MSSDARGSRTICSGPSNSSWGCRSNAVGRSNDSKKCLPGVDVLLTNSEEQWIVVGLATDLVAALSPHVDGVDPRERERPVTELWDGVRFLDGGGLTPALAATELAGCVAYARVVDDSEAVVIGDVACVFQPIDGLSHCLVGRVEVLGDPADGVTTLDGEDSLCRRVVENLVHLVVTNNPVTVKVLLEDRVERLWLSSITQDYSIE